MKKIIEWLMKVMTENMDKVFHYALGSLIAFVVCMVMLIFAPVWVSVLVSFCVTMGLELLKEYLVDDSADWLDVLATMLGGLVVWIPFFF